jgi:hypothetical protein
VRLPRWYLIQVVIWLLTSVPLYVFVALWGDGDWWLIPNFYQSDLAFWEIVLFTVIFFHPLLSAPFAVGTAIRRPGIAQD